MNPLRAYHAVALSAVVPGIGQLFQRRWIPGLFYLASSLGLFGWLATLLTRAMVANFEAALAFAEGAPNRPFAILPAPKVLAILGLFLLVYAAALIDAYVASLRLARTARPPRVPRSGEPQPESTAPAPAGRGPLGF